MRSTLLSLMLLLLSSPAAVAQSGPPFEVEHLDFTRPEAWGMAYATSATIFSSFGVRQVDAPWQVQLSADLSSIPRVSEQQRQVGFNGTKLEDLNKSPIFGRGTLRLSLPAGFAVEAGYTPPVSLDGVRAHGIYALALDKLLLDTQRWKLQGRLYGQAGRAIGDITCSREVAAFGDDLENNPFGCDAPSKDIVELDYYGGELTVAYEAPRFSPFFSVAVSRIHPEVKVRAQVFGQPDNSRLTTKGTIETYALGLLYRPWEQWEFALGVTHTPLDVQREPNGPVRSDAFTNARASVRLTVK